MWIFRILKVMGFCCGWSALACLLVIGSACREMSDSLSRTISATATAFPPLQIAPSRAESSMAYDEQHRLVVLFGGAGLNDTWTWGGRSWAKQHPALQPPARREASMAYDAASGQLILFGGIGTAGSALADTWAWDGTDWQLLSPSTSPPARAQASLVYDAAHQRLVLFGGLLPASNNSSQVADDTWIWDGLNWSPLNTRSSPPARSQASMAYDSVSGRLVLFGGFGGLGTLGDTWTLDGGEWSRQFTPAHPAARAGAAMSFDGQRVVLFAGTSGTNAFNDTWFWSDNTWRRLPEGSPTGPYVATAYNSNNRFVVAYIVHIQQKALSIGDTWLWNGRHWTRT